CSAGASPTSATTVRNSVSSVLPAIAPSIRARSSSTEPVASSVTWQLYDAATQEREPRRSTRTGQCAVRRTLVGGAAQNKTRGPVRTLSAHNDQVGSNLIRNGHDRAHGRTPQGATRRVNPQTLRKVGRL